MNQNTDNNDKQKRPESQDQKPKIQISPGPWLICNEETELIIGPPLPRETSLEAAQIPVSPVIAAIYPHNGYDNRYVLAAAWEMRQAMEDVLFLADQASLPWDLTLFTRARLAWILAKAEGQKMDEEKFTECSQCKLITPLAVMDEDLTCPICHAKQGIRYHQEKGKI